ncbi:MAG: S53 family peptidase [Thermoplasmata archaeon]|nr:S53 family peptidase [Thermoplasmata archaeon]
MTVPADPGAPPVPRGYIALASTRRLPLPGAQRVGPAPPTESVTVSVRVRRRTGGPPLPDPERWAATAPRDRAIYTRSEYSRQFGASEEDLAEVRRFATAHGLAVLEANAARRIIALSGTVAQMEDAFAVRLTSYRTPDGTAYRGREGEVRVPESLRSIVLGVFGLDDRPMARRGAVSGTGAAALTPPTVARLYDYPTLTAGQGQTIGLFEFEGGYRTNSAGRAIDIDQYFAGLGITPPTLVEVPVDGSTNTPQPGPDSPDAEVVLDICVAGAVAPGAAIAVYFAPWTERGWLDIINAAVHPAPGQPSPSVISISYGWPELDESSGMAWTAAVLDEISQSFYEASLVGVTILVASGDHGSSCGLADRKAHVSYPGTDPWVTCCGGTILTGVAGSAFQEGTWDDASGAGGASSTTGGGISDVFPVPTWQQGAKIPPSVNPSRRVGRGVPDISGNASPNSGYVLDVDGAQPQEGGTSAVAPLYAGLVALLNARLPKPVGFLNPTLYGLAGSDAIRNIADGRSNATGGAPGYTSVPGWNACTGLGVVDGNALLRRLQG